MKLKQCNTFTLSYLEILLRAQRIISQKLYYQITCNIFPQKIFSPYLLKPFLFILKFQFLNDFYALGDVSLMIRIPFKRTEQMSCVYQKRGKRKVQGMPQSQTADLPRHQEEEKTDKTKQAQIKQTYEKH